MIKIAEVFINPEFIQRVEREFPPEDDRYQPGDYKIFFSDGTHFRFSLDQAGAASIEEFLGFVRYGQAAYQLGGINELARELEDGEPKPVGSIITPGSN